VRADLLRHLRGLAAVSVADQSEVSLSPFDPGAAAE